MHTYYIISIHLYMCTFAHNYVYILCVLARCHTIIGLLGLEKTTKIIKSNQVVMIYLVDLPFLDSTAFIQFY